VATLTVEAFRVRYPEFVVASASNAQVQVAIDDAGPWLSEARWGRFYTQGLAALAAHFLKGSTASGRGQSGAAGAVTSKKAGDIQLTYAAPAAGSAEDVWLASSVYGQRFLALRKLAGMGAVVAP
jgi:hypothetical protein